MLLLLFPKSIGSRFEMGEMGLPIGVSEVPRSAGEYTSEGGFASSSEDERRGEREGVFNKRSL